MTNGHDRRTPKETERQTDMTHMTDTQTTERRTDMKNMTDMTDKHDRKTNRETDKYDTYDRYYIQGRQRSCLSCLFTHKGQKIYLKTRLSGARLGIET